MSAGRNSEEMEPSELSANLVPITREKDEYSRILISLCIIYILLSLDWRFRPPAPLPRRIVSGITFLLHCEEKQGEEKKLGEEKWTGLEYFSQLCVHVPEWVWVSGRAHRMCVMFGVCGTKAWCWVLVCFPCTQSWRKGIRVWTGPMGTQGAKQNQKATQTPSFSSLNPFSFCC